MPMMVASAIEVLGHAPPHRPRGRNMRQSAIATNAIASL